MTMWQFDFKGGPLIYLLFLSYDAYDTLWSIFLLSLLENLSMSKYKLWKIWKEKRDTEQPSHSHQELHLYIFWPHRYLSAQISKIQIIYVGYSREHDKYKIYQSNWKRNSSLSDVISSPVDMTAHKSILNILTQISILVRCL